MASESAPKSSAEKVRAYRARKRAEGYRLMQRWVPDVDSEEFARAAHQASLNIANSPAAKEEQDWVDSVSVWPWEDEDE